MQPRPEAYETLPFFTTSWLACFAQVGICSIIHSFGRRWCPLREGRSRGRNVWMEAFLGMIEIHRSPQLRWKCKAPSSIAVQHNAQFSGREGGSGHRLLLLGNLQIPVTTMEMVSQQIKWPLWGGGGFPRLEPLEESVPTHSSSTSTKTDSWASPQVTDSEFPGREDVYQVPQVILIIRQVWKALSPHRTNNPETFRGNLSPESHRHKQIHSLIHPANVCCRGWAYCE